jgi:hypothetical protein
MFFKPFTALKTDIQVLLTALFWPAGQKYIYLSLTLLIFFFETTYDLENLKVH